MWIRIYIYIYIYIYVYAMCIYILYTCMSIYMCVQWWDGKHVGPCTRWVAMFQNCYFLYSWHSISETERTGRSYSKVYSSARMYHVCTYLWPAGGQRFTASCTHLQSAVRSQWAAAVADSCRPSWITQTSQTSRQRRRFGVETHQCRCRKGRVPKGWLKHEFPVPKNRWSPCWQAHCEGIYMMFRCYDLRVFCSCQHDSDIFGMMTWVAEPLLSRSLRSVWNLTETFRKTRLSRKHVLHSICTHVETTHPWHAIFWRERKIMSGTNGYRDARNARNS